MSQCRQPSLLLFLLFIFILLFCPAIRHLTRLCTLPAILRSDRSISEHIHRRSFHTLHHLQKSCLLVLPDLKHPYPHKFFLIYPEINASMPFMIVFLRCASRVSFSSTSVEGLPDLSASSSLSISISEVSSCSISSSVE